MARTCERCSVLRAEMRSYRVEANAIQQDRDRHQFGDSRFKDLVLALVGLCNRLIVFIRREPDNYRFTIRAYLVVANVSHADTRPEFKPL